jgi:hypothetical protein
LGAIPAEQRAAEFEAIAQEIEAEWDAAGLPDTIPELEAYERGDGDVQSEATK